MTGLLKKHSAYLPTIFFIGSGPLYIDKKTISENCGLTLLTMKKISYQLKRFLNVIIQD